MKNTQTKTTSLMPLSSGELVYLPNCVEPAIVQRRLAARSYVVNYAKADIVVERRSFQFPLVVGCKNTVRTIGDRAHLLNSELTRKSNPFDPEYGKR